MAWATCCLGRARRLEFFSLSFFFFSFFLPSLGSSLICSGFFFDIYKGYKSSLRDSISMWSPCGKICHIRQHQIMEIESQRLDLLAKIESQRLEMLVNNIVLEPELLTILLEFYC